MQRITIIAIVLGFAVEVAAFRKSKALSVEQEISVAVAEGASFDKESATAGADADWNPFKPAANLFATTNQTDRDARKAAKEAAHAARIAAKKEKQAAKAAARAAKETAEKESEAAKEAVPAANELAQKESEEEQREQAAAKEEEQREQAAAEEEQREKAAAEEKQREQAATKEKLRLEAEALSPKEKLRQEAALKLNEHTEAQGVSEMVHKAEVAAQQELSVKVETQDQEVRRKYQAKVDAISTREERLRSARNAKKLKDARDDPKAVLKRQKKQEKAERLQKWDALQARRLKSDQKKVREEEVKKAEKGTNLD